MSPTSNVKPTVNDIDKDNSDGPDLIVLNTTEPKRLLHICKPPHLIGYLTWHSTTNIPSFFSTNRL
ncbi:hypothetical protein I4U23_005434 [Adineta vaga]|nr:hypothetical protein I4U23_005434 [Adineta vaga]